jgi:tetratricopeptide (TPR) repeat protein
MCGQAEIDGYGFCLGLKSLQNFYKDRQDLHNLIHSVIYLIRQANFRPTHTPWSDMSFLAIRPLGELLDMFHTHEATKCHDKVYALLGMSSDGLDAVNLLPNYEMQWGEVFRRLIKFLLRGQVYVETKNTTEMAIIKSKASILGRVSSVAPCSGWGDTYKVGITSRTTFGCLGYAGEWNACWTLHNSAKSIQQDDIVCILQGAPNPTIVRVCKDYLAVIMILATPPDDERTQKGCIRWSKLLQSARTSSYELVLGWDWAKFPERPRDREAYDALLETTYLDKALGLKELQDQIRIYVERGQWQPTEELGMRLMKGFRKMLGSEHPSTLISMSNLALTYINQRRWNDAEELGKKVVETITRVLGKKHPSTLTSMSNLAFTYMNQGRWKDAEELEEQVVEARTRVLGEEHPFTLTSMSNLALTHMNQGRWKDAEELGKKVVETKTRVLGEKHHFTLISMSNLALTYINQRKWKDAEELGKKVVETKTMVLREEHPSTLISMSNLTLTYMNQGRWKDAEELGKKVVETITKALNEEHPSNLISTSNLASTYMHQARWKDAEELEVQVIEMRTRVLGKKHPSTLISISNLALTYMNQGRWKDAEQLGKKVVETITRVLWEKHPYTLVSKNNLALTHINQGRLKDAEELGEQVIR